MTRYKEPHPQVRHLLPPGGLGPKALCGQRINRVGALHPGFDRTIDLHTFVAGQLTPERYASYCSKLGDLICESCLTIIQGRVR